MRAEPDDLIVRSGTRPVTAASLATDLAELGVRSGEVLLVHSSLSALGWVCGGAQAVVDALLDVLGPDGTLLVPAHSGSLSDPAGWRRPAVPEAWWEEIRAGMPAYRADATPTRMMGAVAETVVRRRDSSRSAHPQVSFAAIGAGAGAILADHTPAAGLGDDSPLGRIYARDGSVLLLGVGHDSNTSLHLAEYRASWPSRRMTRYAAPMVVDGERRWVEWDDVDLDEGDFAAIGAAFAAETGLERTGAAGRGTARLMPQRALVDFAATWLAANRA